MERRGGDPRVGLSGFSVQASVIGIAFSILVECPPICELLEKNEKNNFKNQQNNFMRDSLI